MELVYHYKAKNKYLLGASEHTNSQNSIPHDFILDCRCNVMIAVVGVHVACTDLDYSELSNSPAWSTQNATKDFIN